jgi:hypothetical protein
MTTTSPDRGFPPIGAVPAMPLDQILTADEKARCSLIKIDIEGAEPPVIRRFLETIDQYPRRPALAVEISPTAEWQDLWRQLLAVGYRASDLHNDYDWLAMMKPVPAPTALTDLPALQTDVLFIRD